MLCSQIRQLYTDTAICAKATPEGRIPESAEAAYNTYLTAAKAAYPANPALQALTPLDVRVPYADMLIRLGQLKQAVEDEGEREALRVMATPSRDLPDSVW